MSATEMANKFFGDFVPGCFIHEGFVEKRSLYIASHKALTEKMKSNRTSWESDIDQFLHHGRPGIRCTYLGEE
jgi:hypothetical protein